MAIVISKHKKTECTAPVVKVDLLFDVLVTLKFKILKLCEYNNRFIITKYTLSLFSVKHLGSYSNS